MILVLFTVPFYHFLFLRYLVLAERHFLSDILVPFPDLCNLYSRVYLASNLIFPKMLKYWAGYLGAIALLYPLFY